MAIKVKKNYKRAWCTFRGKIETQMQREREREVYLQDSLIDKMEAPLLPITRPIFPGGTSITDRISSSGALSSTVGFTHTETRLGFN